MTNINAAAKTTVRMFDGTGWDTYKVGSKKHKAAEARRAEFDAKRPTAEQLAARKEFNLKAAAWMRENGVVARGTAWDLAKAGERDVKVLRKANKADGIAVAAAKPAKSAKPAKVAKPADEVTVEVQAETKGPKAAKKARKVRSAAARKGWETRRANAAAKAAEVAEVKAPKAKKAKASKAAKQVKVVAVEVNPFEVFAAPLLEAGLTKEQAAYAWGLRPQG